MAVKEGAPAPDISTPDAFKQALLKAKSISYTDPKAGGSSGTFFASLLEKLGIADAVADKTVLGKRGYEVAEFVASGKAELCTTFISEILTVPGVTVIGPLPGALHNVNTYTAAIPSQGATARGGGGLAARAHKSRACRALDRGRSGAGFRSRLTLLRRAKRLPNYGKTGAGSPWIC